MSKKIIAVIPARGGSKGVPGKNIKIIEGKPLVVYTIEAAKESRYISSLVISTDDPAIAKIAVEHGCACPSLRPGSMAQDDSPTIDALLHMANQFPDYDYMVVLQPTSPLRQSADIDGCIDACLRSKNQSSATTVTIAEKNPYWMYHLNDRSLLSPVIEGVQYTRRQDVPPVYVLNGAVYVCSYRQLHRQKRLINEETVAYVMPNSRSLDIDTNEDLELLQLRLTRRSPDFKTCPDLL